MKTTAGKTRTVARGTRNIKICRPATKATKYYRSTVGYVDAKNLKEALRLWYEREAESCRFTDPLFTGNTLTVNSPYGEETFMAVDE